MITQVSENESLAELYSSPGLVHNVLVGESHIPVVAHGVGGGNFRIDVPKSSDIEIGDAVTFAGEEIRLLGVINQIIENPNTGIATLLLRLPINPTELRMVGVSLVHHVE
jgi:cell shape-determining protein MreC